MYDAVLDLPDRGLIWLCDCPAELRGEKTSRSVKNLGLRCELDCLLSQTVIQDRGPDLKHVMGSLGRPAHLPSLSFVR
jgi:hypothetical protein